MRSHARRAVPVFRRRRFIGDHLTGTNLEADRRDSDVSGAPPRWLHLAPPNNYSLPHFRWNWFCRPAGVEPGDARRAPETQLGRRLRTEKDELGHETVTVFETAPIRPVQPGEGFTEEIILNKLFDLSKPGKYTLRIQERSDIGGATSSNKTMITIK